MDDSTKRPGSPPAQDATGPQSCRRAFRVPVREGQMLTVRVGEEHFGAFDVVEGGVGIFHSRRAAFSVGQPLDDMCLYFKGEPLPVRGRVVHVFRDEHGMIRYGVEFLDMDEDTRDRMHELVQLARKEYLDPLDDDASAG